VAVIELVPYDAQLREDFLRIGRDLRRFLGERAARIDHIGSTAVPGLAAKPIIDVQISVRSFEPFAPLREGLEAAQFKWLADNPDLRKRYFKRSTSPQANLHVRRLGDFSEQAALLFRDYLRSVASAKERYEAVKRNLVQRQWADVNEYAEAKGDCVWALLREADAWAWKGWVAPPSDA
jgi:GrpB-like predicted nucleotidyltransferase (UPF0157 family)